MIEAFLAARRECGEGGFYLFGALIQMDGTITWSAADCIGAGASHSVAEAQYIGTLEILKQLGELKKQNPQGPLTLYADADLIVELRQEHGCPPRGPSEMLDACIDTMHRQVHPLTLRYCSRAGLAAAHSLIDELCRRNGISVKRQAR
jgi:hypothetical protein